MTHKIVGMDLTNETAIFIAFDIFSLDRFFAAKKEKNNPFLLQKRGKK